MPIIKPFKAIYFNPSKIKDLSKVVSPPYDVISSEEQDYLHNLSSYNFTHIDFPKDGPADDKTNNKYTRAKKTFEGWLNKKIMIKDDKPCLYFYKQDYKIMGERHSRMGFISLLDLQEDEESQVYPHENTHRKAVNDRFTLCDHLKSHLSSIFVCYSDKHRRVEKIFIKYIQNTIPMIDVVDGQKIRHKLWRLDDKGLIDQVCKTISGQQLFIADGHHRYRVAQEYRQMRLSRMSRPSTGAEPFNFIMTYFTNIDAKGLRIFPMHRIVKHMPEDLDFLQDFFRIDVIKKRTDMPIILGRAGRNEHAFALYRQDGIKLLRLKNRLLINKHVNEGSPEYKNLDATILKTFVFDKVGIKSDDIIFTNDVDRLTNMVDDHQADAGFMMNPVKISELKAIALHGERMPPKTTYFYPKVLSGLTVYKMD